MKLEHETATLTKDLKWKTVKKYSYDLNKEDQKYLFGKGSDGGMNFCEKAIWLYQFYDKNKNKIPKNLRKETKRLNLWNDRISPMDIPQERQWLIAYGKLAYSLKQAGFKGVKGIREKIKKR